MLNHSVMKSKLGSPRKQGKNAKFFISKADDMELNQNMALAVQQKMKRKRALEHGLDKKMMEATAKSKLGTFKMPARVHQAFDQFYQSTMPVAYTPSPEKTRPSLLDASRTKSTANMLTMHSTLLGKKVFDDCKKDTFTPGPNQGTQKLLEAPSPLKMQDSSNPFAPTTMSLNQTMLSSTVHNLSVLRDNRR